MTMVAGPLRGRRIDVLGFSVLVEDPAGVRRAYRELAEVAAVGEVVVETEAIPLAEAGDAWARQTTGTGGRKLVLVP